MNENSKYKSNSQKDLIEVYFSQCLELRKEVVETFHLQVKYIQISILCLTGTFAYVFNAKVEDALMINLVQMFLIPLICYAFLCMWLGEISRMMVYGNYIYEFELTLKAHTKLKEVPVFKEFPYYETWIRRNQKTYHQAIKYVIVILSFCSIALAMSYVGIENVSCSNNIFNRDYLVIVCVILNIICLVIVLFSLLNIIKQSNSYHEGKAK